MSTGMAPRYSRRSFLKIGAAAAAGLLTLRQPQAQPVGLGISRLNIKSTLPLPGYNFLPFPEQLLERGRQAIDAALVPAYVASQLIQRNMLQPLPGLPGR